MRQSAPIFGDLGRNLNFSGVASCKIGGFMASAVCGRFFGRFLAAKFAYKSHFAQRSRTPPGGGYARATSRRVTPLNTFERFLRVSGLKSAQKGKKGAQYKQFPTAEGKNSTSHRERYNFRAKGKFPKPKDCGKMGSAGLLILLRRAKGKRTDEWLKSAPRVGGDLDR